MISFIDEHRSVFGVEPICRILPIAPSTYYENVAKRLDVDRLSMRNRRDIAMKIEIRRVFNENFQVHGVRKVWRQLQREGFEIARCTVARLMRVMGLQVIIRGKPVKTTVSDKAAPCPLDRVNRQFFAPVHSDNLGEIRIASRVHAPEQTDHCRMRLFLSIGHQFTGCEATSGTDPKIMTCAFSRRHSLTRLWTVRSSWSGYSSG